ncbi:MAG: DHH family phosphoesterase [Candidatus Aenigmarchaeota archaeon]|nr:DHH family phosphoesterase [Candidatus Aenigmarchaeota archaeon]
MEELTKKAMNFLKNIKEKDGVIIVFNNDLDGMCSCTIVKKYLNKLGNDPYIISQPMPPDKNLIRRMQTGVPNKIIFLDMAIDQSATVVKKIKGIADVLIIDHHLIAQDLNSNNVIHFNPRLKDPKIYQSASYLSYKIISKLDSSIEGIEWIGALGAIADYDLSSSQDLIKEAQKKYDLRKLHKAVAILDSQKATRAMTCEQIVGALMAIKDPEKILETQEFMKSYEEIESEKTAILSNAQDQSKTVGNLVLYEISSKFNLRSEISTRLAEKQKDKFVMVYEKVGKKINSSVRNQSKKFNVDKVLKKAMEGLSGQAGGHEAAGGVTIDEKDWNLLIDNILAIIN